MRIDVRLVARSPAAGAVSAYDTGRPGWRDVSLRPALELATGDGAQEWFKSGLSVLL